MKKKERNVAKGNKKKTMKKAPAKPAKKPAAKKPSAKKATPKAASKSVKSAAKSTAKKAAKKTVGKTLKKAVTKPAAKKAPAKAPVQKAPKATQPASTKPMASAPAKKSSSQNLDLSDFITPLDDRVLVMPKEKESMTAGGLYVPDTVEDTHSFVEGHVVSVGRGHRSPKGHLRPMDVQVGDKVLFAQHAGSNIKIQNYDLLILREADVLGVVE